MRGRFQKLNEAIIYVDLNLPYSATAVVQGLERATGFLPPGDLGTLLLGAVLVLVAIVIVFLLKRVLENVVIGIAGFLILKYVLGVNIPTIPGLVISLFFGLGGLGVLLILHFFGLR